MFLDHSGKVGLGKNIKEMTKFHCCKDEYCYYAFSFTCYN